MNHNNNNSLITFPRDPSYLPTQSRSTGGGSGGSGGGGHRHAIQQLHDSKFVGFGEGSSWGEFLRPQGVTANGSTIYCADSRNNRVASWNMEKQTFDYIDRDVVELDRPAGLAAIDNYLVIVDFGNNRVHICQRQMSMNELSFDFSMQFKLDNFTWKRLITFGKEGTGTGEFCRPWGVTIARYSDPTNEWSMGFNNAAHENPKLINLAIGSNNNNSINNSIQNQASWSTYLIGIADRSNNRIQLFKFDAIRQTVTFLHMFGDGPGARHGQFDRPAGLVFNSKLEQIIVADKDNHRVQVFDMSGSYLFKFGERGSKCGQFCYPWDIDVCKTTHNLIVSDTRNRRIQMFSNLGRYITHFNQPIDSPRGVVFLSPLQLMVSDFNKHRLLLITQCSDDKTVSSSTTTVMNHNNNNVTFPQDPNYQSTQPRSTGGGGSHRHAIQQLHDSKFVGFGEGSSWGEFLRPQGVTANGSTIYCADSRNNRVASWNMESQTFDYISRDVMELDRPAGLAAIDNYLVIVDFGNNRVHICQRQMSMNELSFDFSMQFKLDNFTWKRLITFGKEGTGTGEFCRPWGVTIARYSDPTREWSMGLNNVHENPKLINLAIGSNNNNSINNSIQSPASWSTYLIGIADRSNNRIQLFKFDAIRQTVTFLHMFGDGPGARHGQFDRPAGLVFNSKLEQIIVADKDNHRVQVFDMSGSYLFKFGERGSKCGQFCYPWDIDVCKTTHNLIVSDTRNRRIQMFSNLGRYITHFNQPLDSPRGVVFLSPSQLMVSDFNKHRLLLITQCSDDKTVSSSTTTSTPNALMSLIRDPTYIPSQSRSTGGSGAGGGGGGSVSRQNIQQLQDSKFVGFGEGSSWGEFLRPQGVAADESSIYSADSRMIG